MIDHFYAFSKPVDYTIQCSIMMF